jgi:hypothetical protein
LISDTLVFRIGRLAIDLSDHRHVARLHHAALSTVSTCAAGMLR